MSKPNYHSFIKDKARRLIKAHEGVRLTPYIYTVGKCTIGVGRNLTDRGLTTEEVELLFETDFKLAMHILDSRWAKQVGHRATEIAELIRKAAS